MRSVNLIKTNDEEDIKWLDRIPASYLRCVFQTEIGSLLDHAHCPGRIGRPCVKRDSTDDMAWEEVE